MMNMKKTYADECSPESLDRGKNTYGSKPLITRTVEEIEEEAKIEAIATNVGLMGPYGIIGISVRDMKELSKYKDPISVWMSRYAWMLRKEDDEETFY
jgi:hypothetical protein